MRLGRLSAASTQSFSNSSAIVSVIRTKAHVRPSLCRPLSISFFSDLPNAWPTYPPRPAPAAPPTTTPAGPPTMPTTAPTTPLTTAPSTTRLPALNHPQSSRQHERTKLRRAMQSCVWPMRESTLLFLQPQALWFPLEYAWPFSPRPLQCCQSHRLVAQAASPDRENIHRVPVCLAASREAPLLLCSAQQACTPLQIPPRRTVTSPSLAVCQLDPQG
mmetsp:Transcript_29564/g.59671  ORF Transcript_29564/g.59671 Transcript_29564/m.59671 type:complete len:217 (-) Transcript_29564:284-934(-)